MRIGGPVDTGDIEDRRGFPGGGLAIGGGGLGVVGLVVYLLMSLLGGGGGGGGFAVDSPGGFPAAPGAQRSAPALSCPRGAASADEACFVAGVVGEVQRSWAAEFARAGRQYQRTKLVLFTGSTTSGCGAAEASTGPFYCPVDRKVYLDLGFFTELRDRFRAPGDFAQAYVIAHEFGHHVQTLLGVTAQVEELTRDDPSQRNALSVRTELQADCLAGVWARSAYASLDSGDIGEALAAAASVGDDRLQRQATGHVDPETFTHGTSAQRQRWFTTGYRGGDVDSCDTFSADQV